VSVDVRPDASARLRPAASQAAALDRAKARYALRAWLSERLPCELTESMRLNALWDVLRARAAR
jgi:hypothetical protein